MPALRHFTPVRKSAGFTLVELLVVVAIIALLAALAVPHLLEAQVRAKVARVRADLRTIASALEAYAVDHNAYPPNDGQFNITPRELTTPVAFLAHARWVDAFSDQERHPFYGDLSRYYTYTLVVSREDLNRWISQGGNGNPPPVEGIDAIPWNPGARAKYGPWRLASNGPDRAYSDPRFVPGSDPLDPYNVLQGADIAYDPTNGTLSRGNLLRTQRETAKR